MDNTVALAAIGLASSLAVGFFKLLSKLTKSLDKVAKSNLEIARESRRGNDQSEKRNGHLGELVVQNGEQMKVLAENATNTILNAVQNVEEQHIGHAHIDKATVEKETVHKKE